MPKGEGKSAKVPTGRKTKAPTAERDPKYVDAGSNETGATRSSER